MNDWVYRTLMAILAVMITTQLYVIATTKPLPEQCLLGIVMQQHDIMWRQKGIWPTYCVPIDKD